LNSMTESKMFGFFMKTFILIFSLIFLKISRTAGLQPLWINCPWHTDRPDVIIQ
jgi:hypothetical protein